LEDIDGGRDCIMKWIGLTGGIASGKSTVSRLLSQNKIPVIDADAISHELTQVNAQGYFEIVKYFGRDILDSDACINRKKLGAIIFNDIDQRTKLENILHPLVQEKVHLLRSSYEQQGFKLCFYDVPLLFEKNLQAQFAKTVLVYAPVGIQIDRLMRRNHLTHSEAIARLKSQITLREKVKKADYCLDNSTNIYDLEIQVKNLLPVLKR